jgi:hypothetical protein
VSLDSGEATNREGLLTIALRRRSRERRQPALAWVPVVAAIGALGLLLIERGFDLARVNGDLAQARLLLWAGLAAMLIPALIALVSQSPTRGQRLWIVGLLALLLYSIKIIYGPNGVVFPDEYFHFANAQQILDHQHLYTKNELLPASSSYPGLPAIAAAMSQISGLKLFASSVILIAVARVLLLVGLFLLFERLAGDSRIAGLGAVFFAASPNFFYWSAQFAYESLAFPLLVLALLAALRAADDERVGSTHLAAILASCVVVTHHLTGFALAAILWALIVVARTRRSSAPVPVSLAIYVSVAALAWILLVATGTESYLGGIFSRAYHSVSDALGNHGATRTPFQTSGFPTPLDDKVLAASSALLAVALSAVAIVRHRRQGADHALVVLFDVLAALTVVTFALRVFPGAWETGNRASSYVFLGVAFGTAGVVAAWASGGRVRALLAVVGGAVTIAGASVIGWPAAAQLPRADAVRVDGAVVRSETAAATRWLCEHVTPSSHVVADENVGRLLLINGFDHVLVGVLWPGSDLLHGTTFSTDSMNYLRRDRTNYVVVDQRRISSDNALGRFFPRPSGDVNPGTYPPLARAKYDALAGAQKVYDNGNIVIYGVNGTTPLLRRHCGGSL